MTMRPPPHAVLREKGEKDGKIRPVQDFPPTCSCKQPVFPI